MKKLDLEKVWQICNKLSNKIEELSDKGVFIPLLGHNSEYTEIEFNSFLNCYSFKIEDNNIVVYNYSYIDDNWTTEDCSYIPISLLSFGEKELEEYLTTEIKKQLTEQEEKKLAEKENIRQQIESLTKQLDKL